VIRIHFDESTLARTRIAISPLNEVVHGLYLLHREPERVAWPYTGWAARAREILRTVPETAPLRVYAELDGREHGRPTPDVLSPIPPSPRPSLREELAVLRRTPEALVAEQFAKCYPEAVPGFLAPYLQEQDRAFGRLADGIVAFWELAMAPHWSAMRTALDEEVLLRSRALAADGPDALLAGLRGAVRWEPPVLSLVKPAESVVDAVDQRLLLVPLIFAQDRLMCSTDYPDIRMVSYQARGAAVLAEGPGPSPRRADDRLALLIGPGRAAVLRALAQPATTTGLAGELGLAPSTVSEQLATLLAAGVVHRRRSGRRVLYGLEPAGVALLSLLNVDAAAGQPTG
jgi:DNA-binding transcriptional ArsR family regulator